MKYWPYLLKIIPSLLAILHLQLCAQNNAYAWWGEVHNWDGFTPWEEYLTISPAYFGPNALPIPEMNGGKIISDFQIRQDAWAHFSGGDRTFNLFSQINVPLFSSRVSMQVFVVPIENYQLTDAERDKRGARFEDASGWAGGDLWFNTSVLILDEAKRGIACVARYGFKTASGTMLENARFTDTPGYFFDFTFGKDLISKENESLRIALSQGFYVWQLLGRGQKQNDAYLYGLELAYEKNKWAFTGGLSGYAGYLNNGDKPLVNRLQMAYKMSSKLLFNLRLQQGLNDFNYSSFALSCTYQFPVLK